MLLIKIALGQPHLGLRKRDINDEAIVLLRLYVTVTKFILDYYSMTLMLR